jgi:hypothetical protein
MPARPQGVVAMYVERKSQEPCHIAENRTGTGQRIVQAMSSAACIKLNFGYVTVETFVQT